MKHTSRWARRRSDEESEELLQLANLELLERAMTGFEPDVKSSNGDRRSRIGLEVFEGEGRQSNVG